MAWPAWSVLSLLAGCGSPCPPAAAPADPRLAAGLLLATCEPPPALATWLSEASRGGRRGGVAPELVPLWTAACPAVPASELATADPYVRVARECPPLDGLRDAEALAQAAGDPLLGLVVRQWLEDGGGEWGRALAGPRPYPGAETLVLPRFSGDVAPVAAQVVLAAGGAAPAPLAGGGWPWALPGRADGAAPVIAADAQAGAQDLARLAASLAGPGEAVRLVGIAAGSPPGPASLDLRLPAPGEAAGLVADPGPWGVDLWRGREHLPPVLGCDAVGVTVCPEGSLDLVLRDLAAGEAVALSPRAGATAQDLAGAAGALLAAGHPVVLDLSDPPCAPAPEGMVCVPGGPVTLGSGEAARAYRIPTFYADREPVSAQAYAACVAAGFCAEPLRGGLSWPDAQAFCAWSGKRLLTEWEWEKLARGPEAAEVAGLGQAPEWTRSWKESAVSPCEPAGCEGPAPLGPCGGAEPCSRSGLRVLRGAPAGPRSDGTPSARLALSPYTRPGAVARCALSGAEGEDPPPYLGRGSPSVSPVLTRHPARQLTEPWPPLGLPEPPEPDLVATARAVEVDTIEDKPVCGEDVVKSWAFPSGQGGKSELDCRDPITYVETNEKRLAVFAPYIADIGGGYAGVGADQNYDLIAAAHSRWAWIFDYDPNVVRLHRVLEALVLASETPEAFVARFTAAASDESVDLVGDAWAQDPQVGLYQRFYLGYRERLLRIYEAARVPRPDAPGYGWLAVPENYAYVRGLYQQRRIVALPGDMLATRTMRGVARAAREVGVVLRIFYTSNAPTSWGGAITPEWRDNVGALPFDDDSVVLVTWNKGSFGGTDYWHYNVQRALMYQQRVRHPGYRFMWQLAWDRIPAGDPDLTVSGLASR